MTIREIARQLHSLSFGQINSRKYTKKGLESEIKDAMHQSDTYSGKILLHDGDWFFLVDSLICSGRTEYDYYIPDTRTQESLLIQNHMISA